MSLDTDVVIVGGGPVGLVIALLLARDGIKVTVVEANGEVNPSPRAAAYGAAAVDVLERAGIAQECRDIGLGEADTIRWITAKGKLVASVPRPKSTHDPVVCGQHQVAGVILEHLAKYPHASVLWNHRLSALKDNGDSVTAVCETHINETVHITGRYLVGADGARSTTRKLVGCTFDGFTYDKMVVATNVRFPFDKYGFSFAQFVVDPNHFALVRLLPFS